MLRFAHTGDIDFRLRKSDKCVCSIKGWEGVRQNGLISLSEWKSYLNDSEMEGRDESGLKQLQLGSIRFGRVRWKAAMKAD